jgi:hypothetical protein
MSDLVLANRAADSRRLKALVLDSVSSPITRRVYNLGLGEFIILCNTNRLDPWGGALACWSPDEFRMPNKILLATRATMRIPDTAIAW